SMSSRPAIPKHIRQEILFEARHHCALCCCPTALEIAHIIPWCETRDHSLSNLIALCANCHTRYDDQQWPASHMRRYKQLPCVVARHQGDRRPVADPFSVDVYLSADPDVLTDKEQQRLCSIVAAYCGVGYPSVRV